MVRQRSCLAFSFTKIKEKEVKKVLEGGRGGADFFSLHVQYSKFRRLHLNSKLKKIFHFMCIICTFFCCVKSIDETLRGLMQGITSNLHLLFGSCRIMSVK